MSRSGLAVSLSLLASLAACGGATAPPAPPVSVESLAGRDIDMIGVVVDIPDGQFLGQLRNRSPGAPPTTTVRWDATTQAFDRFAEDYKLATEDLRAAGLPVLDGNELSFTEGMFRRTRYRLGGEITRLSVDRATDYEVRITVHWRLYDVENGSFVLQEQTSGLARSGALGDRGVRPNSLLSAFQTALGALVADPGFPGNAGAGAAGG
jgi:hypothetical protein